MKKKMVSIIVPVYNAEKYVDNTINSILAQSYENMELLLIDDGSNDDSLSICKKYEEMDPRVRVYSFQNSGVATARERGFKLSKGEYISFVDSDDSLDREFVEKLVLALNDNYVDMVCCNCIDYNGPNLSVEDDSVIEGNNEFFIDSFLDNKRFCYCIWAKLYKRELLQEISFPKMKYAEDTLLVTHCFQKARKVALLKYAGYNYSDNPNGAMRKAVGIRQALDNLVLQDYVYEICKTKYPSKCCLVDARITSYLFNMICADSNVPYEERKKDITIIRSNIEKYDGRLNKSFQGLIVRIYYRFPRTINLLIQIKHFV